MPILVTADWHIKLKTKNIPDEWAYKRYYSFFEQIHAIDCSLHIIAGDIFDRLPSIAELALYFEFVAGCKVRTFIGTGNHDSVKKSTSFMTHLKSVTKSINPLVEIIDELYEEDDFYVVPYGLIKTKVWEQLEPKVVFTHVRGEIPPHVTPEIDLELLSKFPIVYAGDLHSHSNTQANIVYPGSPMTIGFHRGKTKTGYLLVDEGDLTKWEWKEFQLPQLIRATVTSEDEMVETDYDWTIYELEGTFAETSVASKSELLDKKIVKRKSDVALHLDPGMSRLEELKEYLLYILELDEKFVQEVLDAYHSKKA